MNEKLKEALANGFVTVQFTKKDGTMRTFQKATTNLLLIPNEFHPKMDNTNVRKDNKNSVRMFVDELQAWRSISVSKDVQKTGILWSHNND